jgi:capsular polysaccharide biosynthesis protein
LSDDLLTLGFSETCAAAEVLSSEPAVTWYKPPPGVLVNLSGQPFDPTGLNTGHRPSHARHLDCLRSVHLLWSNFFVADECVSTIYEGDARVAVQQVVANAELSRYIGVMQRGEDFVVSRARLRDAQRVAGPVLFATSDEPHNWGLWLLYVLPAVVHFTRHRNRYRKLFVFAVHSNMRAFLALLGVREDDVILHECGVAYWFDEVHVFRQSMRDFYISPAALQLYDRVRDMVVARHGASSLPKLYIARLRRTRELNAYRGLLEEQALADRLSALGYTAVEPEFMTVEDQVRLFAGADRIVAIGGAGLFNTVFCHPGVRMMDIESTSLYLDAHSNIFAGRGLEYGLMVGQEDPADDSLAHRRWSIDLNAAMPAIADFMENR